MLVGSHSSMIGLRRLLAGIRRPKHLKYDDCQHLLSSNFAFFRRLLVALIAFSRKGNIRLTSVQINKF